MTPSQDIFETLDNISEKDFPVRFMENRVPILEHAKIEIIEFLHTQPMSALKKTRDIVFEELVTKIPELLDREMYARKKLDLLIEDIYVFSFSWLNGLPDRRIAKCLKPTMSFEDSQVNLNEEDLQSQSLAEICVKMQDQIKNLSAEVKELKDRLSKVEERETNAKLQEVKPCSKTDKAIGNETGALKNRIKTVNTINDDDKIISYADVVSGSQIVHKEDNVIVVQAEIHPNPTNDGGRSTSNMGNKGNVQGDNSDGSGGRLTSNTDNKGDGQSDNSDGFRLSAKERRSIQNGRLKLRASPSNHPDVQGNATQTLRIKAAERTETYLVYAGGLALDTNEADIRAHMKDIKIEDVVDVIALKKNKSRYASFCISLNTEGSMIKTFKAANWPKGVVVRPYRPPRQGYRQQSSRNDSHWKNQSRYKDDYRRRTSWQERQFNNAKRENTPWKYQDYSQESFAVNNQESEYYFRDQRGDRFSNRWNR